MKRRSDAQRLGSRSLFFWWSRKKAREVANDLLARFDRPPIVVTPRRVARRLLFLGAVVTAILAFVLWPRHEHQSSPAKTTKRTTTKTVTTTVKGETLVVTVISPAPETVTDTIKETTTQPTTVTETDTATITKARTTTIQRTVTAPHFPPDKHPPWASITRPPCPTDLLKTACVRKRASTTAWRLLSGRIHDVRPSAGVQLVEVSVTQRVGRRCRAYSGRSYATLPCYAAFRLWWPARIVGTRWTFRLRVLFAGRYVVRARATDAAGNRQRPPARRVIVLQTA